MALVDALQPFWITNRSEFSIFVFVILPLCLVLIGDLPDHFSRHTDSDRAVGYDPAHDGPFTHNRPITDAGEVGQDCADADDGIIFNGAVVQDTAVAQLHIRTHDRLII